MNKILFIAFLFLGSGFASAQSKIAHLNSQEVMLAMPSYNTAVKRLESFQNELLNELQFMKKDFEDHIIIYQKMLQTTTSPTLIQIEEEKLKKKEDAIIEREEKIQGEIEAYSRELNQPIIAKFEKAVKIVSDRLNFDYVIDISMVMIHNGPDITQEVITEILKPENGTTARPKEVIKIN